MSARTLALGLVLVLAACGGAPAGRGGTEPPADADAIEVVATTTVLADLVAQVGGSAIRVRSLVPQGGEVHTFDPSPGDIEAVADASLVVLNGLGLDEWALELVEGSGTTAEVVELGEDLPGVDYLVEDERTPDPGGDDGDHGHDGANPHLWLDVANAALYVERIADALALADPDDADAYRRAATQYGATLEALDGEIAERMAAIPRENRRIVSFHEAFPYFAAAYGLEVVGVVVEAPGQDPSAGEIAALVDAIRESGARAVFSEVQFNDRLARTIADEAGVAVESGLHNDSLGDPPADTYVGMMKLNAERIEAALR